MADLRAWRLSREAELELPSGLTVRVRRVSLQDLAAGGMIPAPLVDVVQRLIDDTRSGQMIQPNVKQLAELGPILNVVARAAVIEPALADTPDDEHLGLSELTIEDKADIFRWANSPARALEPFRGEPGGSVAAAPAE